MGKHTTYSFPSERKNWSAPTGFKSYKVKDLPNGHWRVSEKKPKSTLGEIIGSFLFLLVFGWLVLTINLLLEMYLYSHGI